MYNLKFLLIRNSKGFFMSVSMPLSVVFYIADFIIPHPTKVTESQVKDFASQINSIALLNKQCSRVCQEILTQLREIHTFVNKYITYNLIYKGGNSSANPHLLDALCSGFMPFNGSSMKRSFKFISSKVKADIKKIIQLTPQSVFCNIAPIRFLEGTSLLAIACANKNIPLTIVESLLMRGANQRETLKIEDRFHTITILDYVKKNNEMMGSRRLKKITQLFEKYSQVHLTAADYPIIAASSCTKAYVQSLQKSNAPTPMSDDAISTYGKATARKAKRAKH